MMEKIDAIILGASGYGGGELLYWLSRHPAVASLRGTSRSLSGEPFSAAHPNLAGVVRGNFETTIAWQELRESPQPVVFSALPHGELAATLRGLESEWTAAEIGGRLLLVDLSGDFRLADPMEFERANGKPHPCPEQLSHFVYGLPEWNRNAIAEAKRIACAGCFATALQIALLPLCDLEVGLIAATAVTGSSGSGTSASAATHHPTRANDFRAYKILTHQHLSEVRAAMARSNISGTLSFVPESGPFVRGIFAALQFLLPRGIDRAELRARAEETFADSPFVRLIEGSPRVAAVAGSNFADVGIAADEKSAAILIALDNLGKGMAGQAVQVMNLALGLEETTGLWSAGRFPG
ncbi:MAG TPA: N-acetyl-gamma-glutamyl-phosphate reductase [Chthoniobacterales bacterium]